MRRTAWLVLVLAGCGNGSDDGAVGAARITITQVPSNVLCVQISVTNGVRSVVDPFAVTPMQSSELDLQNLPIVSDVFTAAAYSADCSSLAGQLPLYVSDPVTALIQPGSLQPVTLELRHNGGAAVTVGFDDCSDVVCPAIANGASACVDGACAATCNDGYMACADDTCVSDSGCCTENDCPPVENGHLACVDGACVVTPCDPAQEDATTTC